LLEKGYSPDLPTLSAIGYAEIIDYLRGQVSLEEAAAQIRRSTRVLVRRQANWFKLNDPAIHWFQVQPGVVDQVEAVIRTWLEPAVGSKR
jgi:tRNA dimethylallyltransferase